MIIPNIIDIYHGNSINFSSIVDAGIWAVIHKARQGIGSGDPAYKVRMAGAKALGLSWGAYDFATGDKVSDNVAAFLATAALTSSDLPVLDYEDNSQSEMTSDEAYEFLDRVAQILGRPCAIYGGNRIREQINANDPKWIDMAKVAPLWQCRYIKPQPADNTALFSLIPPIPPWKANAILQYTGDGLGPIPHSVPGTGDGADLDVFNGTKEAMVTLFSGSRAAPTLGV
jgi:GH25 family lysozyme M1 (1,4-beta-N-acetylmuramidase)